MIIFYINIPLNQLKTNKLTGINKYYGCCALLLQMKEKTHTKIY
jgi:hypothetical protein